MRCPSCGEELSGRWKFCPECASPLTSAPAVRREERKVVSVLFCDLVGFTAASESADPEDVRARLVPYHALLRERIESFGGTVEKFVGDAVMAVFGAPVTHEDDAERAVRAGLAILSAIEDLNTSAGMDLSVRVGINTGEVVVSLDAHPELGEGFVTGDAVNTAARIQSAAPVGAVAVGESTYAATSRVFAYEALDAVSVKGKTEPVALWRAGAPRARLGADVIRSSDAPLVGRELEVLQLRGVFDRVARDGAVHLVTITGAPGVGKSRLVAELFSYIEGLAELVTWRTGRCLPYGDGVTFWALGEIVKGHAGILDTDDRDAATAKLEAVLPADEDRSWLLARLLPLIGVTIDAGASGGSSASQEESFTAWRRFVESLAATGPAVLVVEDIHWADPALLSFLEHLTSWAEGVPLLVICTARPELFDSHTGWGNGPANTLRLNVGPLSEQETAKVVSQLLGLPVIPASTQQLILERAEGNPLWSEECVRVLRDRNLIDAQGRLRSEEVPLPHGVQALIAARLDTLPAEHKALLADAAVVGRVFWADAVGALGGREPGEVTALLHELTGKEFVRRHRDSTLANQAEFGFWHGLVRDVAYQTLPRSSRAAKHVAASQWLEQQAGDRVADVAEILAEHSGQALELAQAAGDSSLAEEVTPSARRYALLAAGKALALDSARAMALLDRALGLTPAHDTDYPDVLVRWGRAAIQVGRLRDGVAAFRQAADDYQQRGDLLAAGAALRQAAQTLLNLGDPSFPDVIQEALRHLETQPPSSELGLALLVSAMDQINAGAPEAALMIVQRVQPLLTEGNAELVARYSMLRGMARAWLGDADGLAETERSIQLLIAADLAQAAAVGYSNLAEASLRIVGPQATLSQLDSGEAYCQARGLTAAASWLRGSRANCLVQIGRFHDAVALADDLLPHFEQDGDHYAFVDVAVPKALALLEINGTSGDLAKEVLDAADRTGRAEWLALARTAAALDCTAGGRRSQAEALLRDLSNSASIETTQWAAAVHQAVQCSVDIEDLEQARGFVRRVEATANAIPANRHSLLMARAVLAHAECDYATAVQLFTEAADRWDRFGSRLEHAHALLGLAKSLLAAGDQDNGTNRVQEALDLFADMGAAYRVQQCERLLDGGTQSDPRTA
jgi:class 3 adenylate cyclase/tetratricopeptide (TPR) repeat protein